MRTFDAVVIGSGPNGLVAAALLARKGWSVAVLERSQVAGGGIRTEPLTRPGYLHDTYSAFYGMLHMSPVFHELGLDRKVDWRHFDSPVAALIEPGRAAMIHADVERTAAGLATCDEADGPAWRELYDWWLRVGSKFQLVSLSTLPSLGPGLALLRATGFRGQFELARMMLEPVEALARRLLHSEAAAVLLASGITHTDLSIETTGGAPLAMFLALAAQQVGMPVPSGGAGRLAEALVASVTEAGGVVETSTEVARVRVERGRAAGVETAAGEPIGARRAVLADVGPLRLFRDLVGEDQVPGPYLAGLRRFRPGSGIFKLDLALDGPAPWLGEGLDRCGVIHLTGDFDNLARSAFEVRRGRLPERPLLVVGQQSVADPSRAPEGCHTLWVETHVPGRPNNGRWPDLRAEFEDRILGLLEEHAPGLRGRVVGAVSRTPEDLERENPNLVGGDLGAGSYALDQMLVFRPVPGWFRYQTPVRGLYLCSASAHPGGGVHGMCGRNCARKVLADARLPLLRLP